MGAYFEFEDFYRKGHTIGRWAFFWNLQLLKKYKKNPQNQNISFSLAKKMLMIFQMKYVLIPHRCLFVLENWSSCDVQNKTTKV